jgi:2-amino-4-hydroxy-6-hydroxymethyldihydropteridine diphosphokinase
MKYKYYLGLGSNIEPKFEFLQKAITELNEVGNVTRRSAIYESKPWGFKQQDNFVNAVVRFHSELNPFHLLSVIKVIEKKNGRNNNSKNWGPREIDIDILFADNISISKDYLIIPHKYFRQRNFVLKPMAEINHNYRPEYNQNTIKYYFEHSTDKSFVNISIKNW